MAMDDSLITTAEVSKLLGLDRRTISARVRHGSMTPALKLPGSRGAYLFAREEIEAIAKAEGIKK